MCLQGQPPLFCLPRQSQTWVPSGPTALSGLCSQRKPNFFSYFTSMLLLLIHCWEGWIIKTAMPPQNFSRRVGFFHIFFFSSGKRNAQLTEAHFSLAFMLFGIFTESQFSEFCTRISALILKMTVCCYPPNHKKRSL